MANIINIADRQKNGAPVIDPVWRFDLRVWDTEGGPEALVTDFFDGDGLEAADRLRQFAAMLDTISYCLMQQAHHMDPNDDGQILAKVAVFENSRVRLRVNDDMIQTIEQEEWLRRRFDDAKAIVNEDRSAPANTRA
ncbi:hypothetical protein [Aureimonas populi]|uniref:Uncharacterized protein n=1 Tax=Aureimonas populi TaxID=1701758 RepID=A0ABW5CHF1_9HYPH|nr:hypothetical protein [Aureimonas populi]